MTAEKAIAVKDPLAAVMTSPVNLTSVTDDVFKCGECFAAGKSGREG